MRPQTDLSYQLGLLEADYQDELNRGELDDEFTIYDSFHDTAIHENGYLRGLARIRGKLDALTYATTSDTEHLPTDWDWLRTNPEQTLTHVRDAYTDANHGGEGYTWLDYLRGWVVALRYALDPEERPWGSRIHRDLRRQL